MRRSHPRRPCSDKRHARADHRAGCQIFTNQTPVLILHLFFERSFFVAYRVLQRPGPAQVNWLWHCPMPSDGPACAARSGAVQVHEQAGDSRWHRWRDPDIQVGHTAPGRDGGFSHRDSDGHSHRDCHSVTGTGSARFLPVPASDVGLAVPVGPRPNPGPLASPTRSHWHPAGGPSPTQSPSVTRRRVRLGA